MKYATTVNGKSYEIEVNQDGKVTVNGEERTVDFKSITESLYSVIIENASYEVAVELRDGQYNVMMQGDLYETEVLDERQLRMAQASAGFSVAQGEFSLKSPMPGMIVDVRVAEGQHVEKGQSLIVLESMKMENELKAPRAGTIIRIHVSKSDSVEQNKVLLTLG
ncbi:MAG: biotin/lipoyl-binding protein [Anaerolineae bacterium]|nr:biotin/lipoyl-binding protein [Anaerolineae bacterium]